VFGVRAVVQVSDFSWVKVFLFAVVVSKVDQTVSEEFVRQEKWLMSYSVGMNFDPTILVAFKRCYPFNTY